MEKSKKILDVVTFFLKKYYDYLILFILLSWSTYVEYWRLHDFIKWSDLPCMLMDLNDLLLGGVGFQYYQIFGKSMQYYAKIIVSFFIFFLGYFILKFIYKLIKIKWLRLFLLSLFYVFITLIILFLYMGCHIIIF